MSVRNVIVAAIALASAGVDYTPKNGAVCPVCGKKRMRVRTTRPWDGNVRVRFHECTNPRCVLCKLKKMIKSIQIDSTGCA